MSNYWKDKQVLVTGSDGFIGSHLTERLVEQDAKTRAFVCYNSFGKNGWLDSIRSNILKEIEIFPGDIRDCNRVMEAVAGQEYVFHLSSLVAIPYSYHAPDSYVQTNIGGALNVLNACRMHGIYRMVHTSTSEVYGTAQYVPIDEKHPLRGQSPYSASKIGADMLAESFFRSFDLPVTIVRPFNTYGPRQSVRAVIPTIISQLINGNESIRLGALTPTRDFNYVEDTVSGFLLLAETDESIGKVVNIGSGREISIGNLVKMLFDISGKSAAIMCEEGRLRPEKSEVTRLCCDASLAERISGWKPSISLEEGLKKTYEWFYSNSEHHRSDSYIL